MIIGPCQETSDTAITLNPESNFTRREKNHSLFHWNTLTCPELLVQICMVCKNAASMTDGISMDQEICLILGQVSLSLLLRWETSRRIFVVRWETDKKVVNNQARSFMARTLDKIGKKCWAEGEAKMVQWKPKLGNARRFRGIYFIDHEDKELKKPSRLQDKQQTVSMETPVVNSMISNQDWRVFWKPVNPQDCVWKTLYGNIMKTILQEKGAIHHSILIWFTIRPKFRAMKVPAAKAAVDKEWEKLEKISARNLKVRSTNEVIDETRTKGAKHFASLMDNCHLKNAELETKLIQYLLNKDHQHLKWRQRKSWISFPDCRVAMDKQLMQHLLRPS